MTNTAAARVALVQWGAFAATEGGHYPIVVCEDCGFSFHDDNDGVSRSLHGRVNRDGHRGHALEYPTDGEMRTAGWTPSEMAAWPYGQVRRAA